MIRHAALAAVVLAGACDHLAAARPEPLPLGAGFRDPADQCRVVGETAFTNQFLDDSSTLVGCPEDYEGTGVFMTETGATQVAEAQGYLLFTVPDA